MPFLFPFSPFFLFTQRGFVATRLRLLLLLLVSLLTSSCGLAFRSQGAQPSFGAPSSHPCPPLSAIHLVDRNGVSETISQQDRLREFRAMNFLKNQPYKKVMRIFGQDGDGEVLAIITSYYENGQLSRYLEAVNGRSHGYYREWYDNGQLHIEAFIVGGLADLTPVAEESWLYQGMARVWDRDGHLQATIPYLKGRLEGLALHYHPSGALWKQFPYRNNLLEGQCLTYYANGTLLQKIAYVQGKKEGEAFRYWPDGSLAFQEEWHRDSLMNGSYYDLSGVLVAQIERGSGRRALFGKSGVIQLQEYRQGSQEGEVRAIDEKGRTRQLWYLNREGEKEGIEREFWCEEEEEEPLKPKLEVTWSSGMLQGKATTWYRDGTLQSQRELVANQKNGMLTAWYRDGSLMLVEQYEKERLIRGEYYRRGESYPISEIDDGDGLATLYDEEGIFLHKVIYQGGRPLLVD